MATGEINALLTGKDSSGNLYLIFPVTKVEMVDGLEELLAQKSGMFSRNITLSAAGWDEDNQQTVAVDGVTAGSTVLAAGDNGSEPEYTECEVWCSAQAVGSLTFSCVFVPATDLVANVTIFT